ncbi:MAG: hypothetical protein HY716_17885 [Planctomycetes bacterium]|nr:hypothetical protein [Planctomycetota bacterium]
MKARFIPILAATLVGALAYGTLMVAAPESARVPESPWSGYFRSHGFKDARGGVALRPQESFVIPEKRDMLAAAPYEGAVLHILNVGGIPIQILECQDEARARALLGDEDHAEKVKRLGLGKSFIRVYREGRHGLLAAPLHNPLMSKRQEEQTLQMIEDLFRERVRENP